ncbi:hypothetical protein NHX12_015154 [Muraenolepis orangiensis]|uniref:C-type lectin domain-containing protein n=1 Tax=Muraenolepis orangiensis TaxID=630683 RepID=A0A9Q0D9C8_9TELE|nr:hypothetical protein NHX12_015154 [Muraenolepis orangiensis]
MGRNITLVGKRLCWSDALLYCRDFHWDLLSIRGPEEQEIIDEMVSRANFPLTSHLWVGLRRYRPDLSVYQANKSVLRIIIKSKVKYFVIHPSSKVTLSVSVGQFSEPPGFGCLVTQWTSPNGSMVHTSPAPVEAWPVWNRPHGGNALVKNIFISSALQACGWVPGPFPRPGGVGPMNLQQAGLYITLQPLVHGPDAPQSPTTPTPTALAGWAGQRLEEVLLTARQEGRVVCLEDFRCEVCWDSEEQRPLVEESMMVSVMAVCRDPKSGIVALTANLVYTPRRPHRRSNRMERLARAVSEYS